MASRSVNKVILIGHLGKDAETTYTPGGVARSRFTVATNRRWKDQQSGDWKEETDWSTVVLWRGENVANYLLKGKQVYVEGRLRNYSYDDKDGRKVYSTEVVADDVILLGGRGGEGGGGEDFGGGMQSGRSGGQRGGGEDFGGGMQSMPRSAQQNRPPAAKPQGQGPARGGAEPFEAGITDDDVPF